MERSEFELFEEGTALITPGSWRVVEVSGSEAESYLQRMVSADLKRSSESQGLAATLMTGKGKLLGAFEVYRRGDRFHLVTEASHADALAASLQKLIILEEVEVGTPDLEVFSLQGPGCGPLLSEAGATLEVEPVEGASCILNENVSLHYRSRCRAGGWDCIVAASQCQDWIDRFEKQGARPVSASAAENARIAAGIPRFGFDATGDNLAPECGYARSLSYDKGCYAGQEVVARIRTYGHVNRVLRRLTFQRPFARTEAAAVLDAGVEVGHVTSQGVDGEGVSVAIALVRYKHADIGKQVEVSAGADSVPATIQPLHSAYPD